MTEVSDSINSLDTICHYKRFSGFLEPNCNGCRVGFYQMVDLLRLFAENGLRVPFPDPRLPPASESNPGDSRPLRWLRTVHRYDCMRAEFRCCTTRTSGSGSRSYAA